MKISQIITEKYENQDPNRPPDEVNHYGDQYWFDTMGRYHRDGDLPAYINNEDEYQEWYQHGKIHRDGDKPAHIGGDGTQVWLQHGERHRDGDKPAIVYAHGTQSWYQHGILHRETGPAIIHANGDVEFWLNHVKYTEEEWAEKVGMRKHEMLMMKNKLGLH
jgi:hypothetical protein